MYGVCQRTTKRRKILLQEDRGRANRRRLREARQCFAARRVTHYEALLGRWQRRPVRAEREGDI